MKIRVRPTPASEPAGQLDVDPLAVRVPNRAMRVLDFDVEARPLHWISGDYVSKEITAMAWAWIGESSPVSCYLLGETDPVEMLQRFVLAFNQADMVTGHYVLGYDLPMIQGALTEYQLPPLGDKLVQDTKVHLLKRAGLSSSQENIAAMLGLQNQKVKMDQQSWRDANRLTPAGRERARARVTGDVLQHMEMRRQLLELGYLTPPIVWRSNTTGPAPTYTP